MDTLSAARPSKLPLLVFSFWVMKTLATTLGETGADYVSHTLDAGYTVSSIIFLTAFALTLAAQLSVRRYIPFIYWAVIVSTSTFGTAMSDYMDRTLELGYLIGSAILLGTLVAVLAAWRLTEGTLSVSDVRTRRAEIFYWTAILVSNTLGTALGDYLADDVGLGFAGGAGLTGGLIALIVGAFYLTPVSRVALFWAAFVLTRPFGATMGDLLTKTKEQGGLDLGPGAASAVLAAALVAVIAFTMHRQAKTLRAKTLRA